MQWQGWQKKKVSSTAKPACRSSAEVRKPQCILSALRHLTKCREHHVFHQIQNISILLYIFPPLVHPGSKNKLWQVSDLSVECSQGLGAVLNLQLKCSFVAQLCSQSVCHQCLTANRIVGQFKSVANATSLCLNDGGPGLNCGRKTWETYMSMLEKPEGNLESETVYLYSCFQSEKPYNLRKSSHISKCQNEEKMRKPFVHWDSGWTQFDESCSKVNKVLRTMQAFADT